MDLTKPKKELKDPLTILIENMLKEIEGKVIKSLNDKFKEKIDTASKDILKKIGSKINVFFDKYEKHLLNELKKSNKSMENFCKQIDSIEETFLILYQNIKQNQFLYANYPQDWIKELNNKVKEAINQ